MNKLFFILSVSIIYGCNRTPEPVTNVPETTQMHQKIEKASKDTFNVVENSTKNVPRLSDSTNDASAGADTQDKKNVSNSKLQAVNTSSKSDKSASTKSTTNTTPSKAKAVFEQKVYNFGTIKQGETIKTKFKFKNTGKKPLVVKKTEASCGCTQPGYPFIPIDVGEEGYISVNYDSKGKEGHQKPMLTVYTNGDPAVYLLYLEGIVEAPPKKEEEKELEEGKEELVEDEEPKKKKKSRKKKIESDSLELLMKDSLR